MEKGAISIKITIAKTDGGLDAFTWSMMKASHRRYNTDRWLLSTV